MFRPLLGLRFLFLSFLVDNRRSSAFWAFIKLMLWLRSVVDNFHPKALGDATFTLIFLGLGSKIVCEKGFTWSNFASTYFKLSKVTSFSSNSESALTELNMSRSVICTAVVSYEFICLISSCLSSFDSDRDSYLYWPGRIYMSPLLMAWGVATGSMNSRLMFSM